MWDLRPDQGWNPCPTELPHWKFRVFNHWDTQEVHPQDFLIISIYE